MIAMMIGVKKLRLSLNLMNQGSKIDI